MTPVWLSLLYLEGPPSPDDMDGIARYFIGAEPRRAYDIAQQMTDWWKATHSDKARHMFSWWLGFSAAAHSAALAHDLQKPPRQRARRFR